ncbi:MAG TPA: threonylcarbamoyl-AMP synthase [Clostridiales bacterium]|jgi:L-threonylcarbamoyladenylate synthase|nr:threonylcarbamoyl-AMP synthase [Clostridiales bacterium]HBL81621.1 threonylcarbamoyl-AMP synthase [Clostridiales bacterium]
MTSKMIKIESTADFEKLSEPAKALAEGKLVAFPTETVYGLGGNALDAQTVKKIYGAKGRPSDNPLIVHVSSKDDVYSLAETVPENAEKILDILCPGPITIILNKSNLVPDVVTAGGKTVAIRFPENEIARELIKKSGVPVAAPSANLSGRPSPTTAAHVAEDLSDKIDYIIDGGPCRVGLESTVIDLTVTPPRILRPGGVSQETLAALLGEVTGYAPRDEDTTSPKSPGMKYKHYAPKAEMVVFEGKTCREAILKQVMACKNKKVCVLTAGQTDLYDCDVIDCGKEPVEYAKALFGALREADALEADVIFAELPFAPGGIVTALKNRIYKSCGGNVITCKS